MYWGPPFPWVIELARKVGLNKNAAMPVRRSILA